MPIFGTTQDPFGIGERIKNMFLDWIISAIEMVVEFLQNTDCLMLSLMKLLMMLN